MGTDAEIPAASPGRPLLQKPNEITAKQVARFLVRRHRAGVAGFDVEVDA